MYSRTICSSVALLSLYIGAPLQTWASESVVAHVSLAGNWNFKLDPQGIGQKQEWFKQKLPNSIELPGSCEQRGYGIRTEEPSIGRLTHVIKYVGPAWYQKEIHIPAEWKGKRIELFLERCHWQSNAWVDGQSLAAHHMLDQAKAFAKASGKFSILLYKEEIEACLRTYPYGGFQILEARDFPGQGTAIVGWLDAFWDSKGLITPEDFRRFCNATVCLLRMPKRVLTATEPFLLGLAAGMTDTIPRGIVGMIRILGRGYPGQHTECTDDEAERVTRHENAEIDAQREAAHESDTEQEGMG